MSENRKIKFPIAYDKKQNKLLNISDVRNKDNHEFICSECETSLIPILKHPTPHFRHKGSDCNLNNETYIHWLAKEAAKELKEFTLPELNIDDLSSNQIEEIDDQIKEITSKYTTDLHPYKEFKAKLKNNLLEKKTIQIKNTLVEETYESELGRVIIDIVFEFTFAGKESKIFIEPYVTNEITEFKRTKLTDINISTVAMSLNNYRNNIYHNFTFEKFKEHLSKYSHKEWGYFKIKKFNILLEKYYEYVRTQLEENKSIFLKHIQKKEELAQYEKRLSKLNKEIEPLINEQNEIYKRIEKLNKDLGINSYQF